MKTTLVATFDSGRFKAYRLEESPRMSTPRLTLLEEWETEVNRRISEQVTDQAGQFPKGSRTFAQINDMADGEQHNLDLERRRRSVKRIAARIGELLEREKLDSCYLAASQELNHAVMEGLAAHVRPKIQKVVAANLTRLNASEVIGHFVQPG
jgi:hypothetical protein